MKDFRGLEPRDYFGIPWKRRWYFLAATLLVIAGVSVYAWLRPDRYRSETRILVESATLLDDPLSPSASRDRTEDRINSIRQLLESRKILQRIVEEFKLRSSDTSIPMEDALKGVRTNLEVLKTSGNTFAMAYYHTDPLAAQMITKRLAEILIQQNQEAQQDLALEKSAFMSSELQKSEDDLANIDSKLKKFKETHLGELPEQGTANMNALSGLHSQLAATDNALDRARDQQKMLEFRLQEQQRLSVLAKSLAPKDKPVVEQPKAKEPPSPLEVQLAAKKSQLAEITARYTAKHPDVVRLTKEVADLEQQLSLKSDAQAGAARSTALSLPSPTDTKTQVEPPDGQAGAQVVLNAEAEVAQARYELGVLGQTISRREKEREGIVKNIDLYQRRLNLAPALEQEMLALSREYETKKQQVGSLQTRKFNSKMVESAVRDKKNDNYRILDDASLPERPVFPARPHIILIGIAGGLIAGVAAAFTREYFESSLATEQEAAMVLKLPVLVSVPEIQARPKAISR